MASSEEINADMLGFWNGHGGRTWVERQAHTDTTLEPVIAALIAFAAPRKGERVLDVGCGCGAPTMDFARRVGASGRVVAIDISSPMLAEGQARAEGEGLSNIEWREADAASDTLEEYDLLTSAFGTMFFGDPVRAFANMRSAAAPGARMAIICWRSLAENPWMGVPMAAVARHLPPRPAPVPNAPGMFGFCDPEHVTAILTAAGWAPPTFRKLNLDLDIAAGRGLDEAVDQVTKIGAVNSWLRSQPPEIIATAVASLRQTLAEHTDGPNVRLPAAMWLIGSRPA
ncbi:class I SAM-dependent methyltransferase [Defluviimonas sp. SAOS-178_SWC]|uniref:class I SAM-dependent methyltransferase n=1 Tax=Defluviimonas sp. SAOS-178_SWC TaxID=3121287 RepID=UPI00322170BE